MRIGPGSSRTGIASADARSDAAKGFASQEGANFVQKGGAKARKGGHFPPESCRKSQKVCRLELNRFTNPAKSRGQTAQLIQITQADRPAVGLSGTAAGQGCGPPEDREIAGRSPREGRRGGPGGSGGSITGSRPCGPSPCPLGARGEGGKRPSRPPQKRSQILP